MLARYRANFSLHETWPTQRFVENRARHRPKPMETSARSSAVPAAEWWDVPLLRGASYTAAPGNTTIFPKSSRSLGSIHRLILAHHHHDAAAVLQSGGVALRGGCNSWVTFGGRIDTRECGSWDTKKDEELEERRRRGAGNLRLLRSLCLGWCNDQIVQRGEGMCSFSAEEAGTAVSGAAGADTPASSAAAAAAAAAAVVQARCRYCPPIAGELGVLAWGVYVVMVWSPHDVEVHAARGWRVLQQVWAVDTHARTQV